MTDRTKAPRLGLMGSALFSFWGIQTVGWLYIGVMIFCIQYFLFQAVGKAVAGTLVRVLMGYTLTLGMREVHRKILPELLSLRRMAVYILLLSAVSACIANLGGFLLNSALGVAPTFARSSFYAGGGLYWMTLFVGWNVLYLLLLAWRQRQEGELALARVEAESRRNEMEMLRAQLNSHFLFNGLSSIAAYVEEDPEITRKLVHNMADYLRFALARRDELAPFGDEAEALRNYLEIEKARFEKALDYELAATDAAKECLAPTPILQPLVENAIKYGMKTSPIPLRVRISATVQEGLLVIEVANTGKWIEGLAEGGGGIGLANLRRKLDLVYAGRARVTGGGGEGWARVRVTLPFRAGPKTS